MLSIRGSVGFFCRGISRLSSIILNSPLEYEIILTFVRAHEDLAYFIRSLARSPKTAVIPGPYLIAFVYFNSFNCDRKGQSYPVEYYLESVEEYSEGKIHKSEPEPGNGNVDTLYFVNQATGNTRISRTEFVYAMNEHAIANVYSVIFELPS